MIGSSKRATPSMASHFAPVTNNQNHWLPLPHLLLLLLLSGRWMVIFPALERLESQCCPVSMLYLPSPFLACTFSLPSSFRSPGTLCTFFLILSRDSVSKGKGNKCLPDMMLGPFTCHLINHNRLLE